ncbi:RIMS-binding protein 2 [Fasciola gigantica]|uniref:RIMS-binding protein 2 n=1 Tax=Fasciola gigantica TaxID=46835 RepID=A0A504ZBU2_FASGI|nr:RIMS-binding protein 2 [Fasciola gigantica]
MLSDLVSKFNANTLTDIFTSSSLFSIQKLHEINDTRQQLLLEYSALKAKLEAKLAEQVFHLNSSLAQTRLSQEQTTYSILCSTNGEQAHLRELEKRCALQQLRHEEVLLELEDARKRSKQDPSLLSVLPAPALNADSAYTRVSAMEFPSSYSTPTVSSVITATSSIPSNRPVPTEVSLIEGRLGAPMHSLSTQLGRTANIQAAGISRHITGRLFASSAPDIPAPSMITLERQLIHSVLISWKPPDQSIGAQTVISAYHIYVDDLPPDTLHRVCVQALPQTTISSESAQLHAPPNWNVNTSSGVDTQHLTAFIEFRTLPVDDHAIIPLRLVKEHLDQVFLESQPQPALTTTVDLKLEGTANPQMGTFGQPVATTELPQTLLITVHSTVPMSAIKQDAHTSGSGSKLGPSDVNSCASVAVLKGSSGPGSRQICLTPELLVAAGGSLEGTLHIFGAKLSQQLGIALLMRHRMEESRENAVVTSSPEHTWPSHGADGSRGIGTRFSSARSSAPWPWPAGFGGSRTRGPISINRSPNRTHRGRYSRKSFRQTRSMSDDYEPRPGHQCAVPPDNSFPDEEENNSDSAWSSETPFGRHPWLRASSLYNLNHRIPSKYWRPRGAAKSSWDLRTLHNYDDSVGRLYSQQSKCHQEYKRAMKQRPGYVCDWTIPCERRSDPHSLGTWPDAVPRTAPFVYPKISGSRVHRRFGNKLYREFGSTSPGPFITALSSSSNDEKRGTLYPDFLGSESARRLNTRLSSGEYIGTDGRHRFPPPRSRSTSPHRSRRPGSAAKPTAHITRDSGHSNGDSRFNAVDGPSRPSRSRYIEPRPMEEAMQRDPVQAQNVFAASFTTSKWPDQPPVGMPPRSGSGQPTSILSRFGQAESQAEISRGRADSFVEPGFGWPIGQRGLPEQNRSGLTARPTGQAQPTQRGFEASQTDGVFQQSVHQAKQMRMVIALYDYDPATMSPNPDAVKEELPFREGQLIKIFGGCDEDGFYLGECNGLRGLVPSNMVSHPDRELPPSVGGADGAVSVDNRLQQAREADAKLDNERFSGRSDGSVALPPGQVTKPRRDGDSVTVTQRPHTMAATSTGAGVGLQSGQSYPQATRVSGMPGYGRNTSNEIHDSGLNQMRHIPTATDGPGGSSRDYTNSGPPTSYNKPTSPPDQRYRLGPSGAGANRFVQAPIDQAGPYSVTDRGGRTQPVRSMVAIYDYDPHVLSPNADAEMELSFRTGDHITVYGEMDEDGFYTGETMDGRRGLVPSNFLRELSLPGSAPSSTSQSRALLTRDQRTRGSQNSVARVERPHDERGYRLGPTGPYNPTLASDSNPQLEHSSCYDTSGRGGAPIPNTRRPDDPYDVGPPSERTPRNRNVELYGAPPGSPTTSGRFAPVDAQPPSDVVERPSAYSDRYTAAHWSRENEMDDRDLTAYATDMPKDNQNKRVSSAYTTYRGTQPMDRSSITDPNYPGDDVPNSNQRRRSTLRGLFR